MQKLHCDVIALIEENSDLDMLCVSVGHTITFENGQRVMFQTRFWDRYADMSYDERVIYLENKTKQATEIINSYCLKAHDIKISTGE